MFAARRFLLPSTRFVSVLSTPSRVVGLTASHVRHYATEEAIPLPKGSGKSQNPKLTQIADNIASLTLIETAELVGILKVKLNIADIPVMSAPSGGAGAAAAAPAKGEVKEDAAPKKEQSEFVVKLEKFDDAKKAQAIRVIKEITGLALVEAKKFVESAPKVVKERVPKEEAEKLKKKLEEAGATVLLE